MKKQSYILIFILLVAWNLPAQIVNIPDPYLKNRLVYHYILGGVLIDTNNDGEIQVSEAEAVYSPLILRSQYNQAEYIQDMTGIEAFVNATELECQRNQIDYLDLSQNTALEIVDCRENGMGTLILGNNTGLRELWCSTNGLTQLDVSQCSNIEVLSCSYNTLNVLNVTNNTSLLTLGCNDNNLSNIDLSQNIVLEKLFVANNNLTELDINNIVQLSHLVCGNNLIENLDVSNCNLIDYLWGGAIN